jgi:hypothetical protein
MKKTLTIMALMAGATAGYSQGVLAWGDYIESFTFDVFAPQTATPTVQQYGNSSVDSPVGSTVYTGAPLGGANNSTTSEGIYGNGNLWTIALFAVAGSGNNAGIAAAEGANTPITTSLFQTSGGIGLANAGAASGASSAGVFSQNNVQLVLPFTGPATFQLEAWYNGGNNTTYANSTIKGVSQIETISTLGNGNTILAPTLGVTSGDATEFPSVQPTGDALITSFSLANAAPEPSTIALGVIGASAFLFRRRK